MSQPERLLVPPAPPSNHRVQIIDSSDDAWCFGDIERLENCVEHLDAKLTVQNSDRTSRKPTVQSRLSTREWDRYRDGGAGEVVISRFLDWIERQLASEKPRESKLTMCSDRSFYIDSATTLDKKIEEATRMLRDLGEVAETHREVARFWRHATAYLQWVKSAQKAHIDWLSVSSMHNTKVLGLLLSCGCTFLQEIREISQESLSVRGKKLESLRGRYRGKLRFRDGRPGFSLELLQEAQTYNQCFGSSRLPNFQPERPQHLRELLRKLRKTLSLGRDADEQKAVTAREIATFAERAATELSHLENYTRELENVETESQNAHTEQLQLLARSLLLQWYDTLNGMRAYLQDEHTQYEKNFSTDNAHLRKHLGTLNDLIKTITHTKHQRISVKLYDIILSIQTALERWCLLQTESWREFTRRQERESIRVLFPKMQL